MNDVAQTALLEAREVTKVFSGTVRALDRVDLSVAPHTTTVLIGESGSGKSTLLRLFNRLEEPTSGAVWVGGRPAAEQDPITLRRRIGFVQQEGGLLPHWRVERNVALVPRLLGWDAARCRRRAAELLDLVGLPPARFAARYPRELSGGQRQRVAFARALAADPELVLLDEPFGALDALTRTELQDEFQRLQRQVRKTMVLVTHDLHEAFKLADRIAVMKEGRILQCAAPAELEAAPAGAYVRELLAHHRGPR